VLTGEAAVNLSAVGEGMVAGDLVNTAARIQSAAEPATVLVGEATRRASEQAIAFEQAGEHALKGKAEPVQLWRAVRVTAARGGALRSEGLEAPFVGRERELRLVKEVFHASAEQSRAHLVQVTGIAGIGKSRLSWEFFKYLDGLAETVWWHRGRCLAYGEGVAYWALAEMVRMRAQILEGEAQDSAREKLAASLAEHVPDAEERAWVGPRLANLLGLEERSDADRQDLFAAWRLFFERLADEGPVVMVFEDLQWADEALLAFVEFLLEWSGSKRLFVLSLARPELAEQSPDFARSIRNAATLALEPLSDGEMTRLLDGYVPGLPDDLKAQVLARAQGIPLYAVETVRMLLDRGLLAQDGSVYRPMGEIGALEVPESLHALAAARLDGLPPEERRLVQEACVLGKTFTKRALAAFTGRTETELDSLLSGLVRKEVLSLQADPRAPERGQYGFLQELFRQVAYDTLSRRDRKARHLAAVDALEQSFEGADQEVPEVIAAHLLAAADAGPDDSDTSEIRLRARTALVQAGERTAALAAPEEAQRYLDQAAGLAAEEPQARANLLERAGTLAYQAGRTAEARERIEQAIDLHREHDDSVAAALAGVALADVDVADGRLDEAKARFQAAAITLEEAGPTPELAATLASLGRMEALREDPEASATVERGLRLAETLGLEEVLVQGLINRAIVLNREGRLVEARLLLEGAFARAKTAGLAVAEWRALNNLTVLAERQDLFEESIVMCDQLEAGARQRGDYENLLSARLGPIGVLLELGRWDEALARVAESEHLRGSHYARSGGIDAGLVHCARGQLQAARAILDASEWQRDAQQPTIAAAYAAVESQILRSEGRFAESLVAAERGLGRGELSITEAAMKRCIVYAIEAALQVGDLSKADELLGPIEVLRPGELTPFLEGQRARLRALIDARSGSTESVERGFTTAELVLGGHAFVYALAITQLEHAEWLAAQGRMTDAEPLLARSRETFERLEATPWIRRLEAIQAGEGAEVPA
jgi:tetratricopeptide (TPR) repeat protein